MNRPIVKITCSEGHTFWIDVAFLKRCPNPYIESSYYLFNTLQMKPFLHNPNGPAVNNSGYYLLGESLTIEQWKAQSFTYKLESFLDE